MIYILDAYNVIHKIPALERTLDQNLRSSRDTLVELCRNFAARRGDISEIILVFDGNSKFNDLPQEKMSKIRLIFSETGEDADEKIVQILERLSEIRNKCVVSDDNFVRNHARAYETSAMSVSEFERLINPKSKKPRNKPSASDDFFLSPKAADEITKAYKKELGLG